MDDHVVQDERRIHPSARRIFVKACVLLAPLVESNEISPFAMMHMIRDRFPELSVAEAHIVIVAIERLHRERRLQTMLVEQTCR